MVDGRWWHRSLAARCEWCEWHAQLVAKAKGFCGHSSNFRRASAKVFPVGVGIAGVAAAHLFAAIVGGCCPLVHLFDVISDFPTRFYADSHGVF